MRKYLYMLIFALIMLSPITEVSANDIVKDSNVTSETYEDEDTIDEETDILDLDVIRITAGLKKEQEVTFDKVRNISGEAAEGTKLVFKVYKEEQEEIEEIEEIESYSQSVGASGLFSQLIELKEGKNYIEIIVKQEDKSKIFIFEIDRKKEEIKKELEEVKIDNIFSEEKETTKGTVIKSLLK